MKGKLSAIFLAGLMSAPAFADTVGTNYAGLQFAQATYDESGVDDLNPTALIGRLGHYFHENFSLEGRLGFGLSDDSLSGNGLTADFEIDSLFGFYGVGHLPINEVASVYALAGFTQGEASITVSDGTNSASESDDDSGFSYGLGAAFNVSPNAALTVEYISYLDKSDYQLTALSAGMNFTF